MNYFKTTKEHGVRYCTVYGQLSSGHVNLPIGTYVTSDDDCVYNRLEFTAYNPIAVVPTGCGMTIPNQSLESVTLNEVISVMGAEHLQRVTSEVAAAKEAALAERPGWNGIRKGDMCDITIKLQLPCKDVEDKDYTNVFPIGFSDTFISDLTRLVEVASCPHEGGTWPRVTRPQDNNYTDTTSDINISIEKAL